MNPIRTFLAAVAGSLALAATFAAQAHHSVSAQFDASTNKTAVGVFTRAELINPHSYLHFDIKNSAGVAETWSFETLAPAALKMKGLSVRDTLKVGETYKLVFSPARSKSAGNIGLLSSIVLPDGRMVAFGAQNNIDASRELTK